MDNQALSPDLVRQTVHYHSGKKNPTSFPQKKWGPCLKEIEAWTSTRDLRNLVLGWLFALPGIPFEPIESTNDLTPQQKNGIYRWIGSTFNEDTQEWASRSTFGDECLNVLNAARFDYANLIGDVPPDLPFKTPDGVAGVVSGVLIDPMPEAPPSPADYEGALIGADDESNMLPDGAEWCRWCGEFMVIIGQPCESCKLLGAEHNTSLPAPPMTNENFNNGELPRPPMMGVIV